MTPSGNETSGTETSGDAASGSDPGMYSLGDRMRGLLTTQFLGAFNDNAWKMIITLLAIDRVAAVVGTSGQEYEAATQVQTMIALIVLTVPLILFSIPAGVISDRISKRSVIVALKLTEIVFMAAGFWVLFIQPQGGTAALVVLGLMGAQSALFSPAKYGIIPELVPHKKLSVANGYLEMWSTIAIIIGTASAGGFLWIGGGRPWVASILLTILAGVGFVAALSIPNVRAAGAPGGTIESHRQAWRAMQADRVLWLSVLGGVLFWMVGSLLLQLVLVYGKTVLHLSNQMTSLLTGVVTAGIAVGSLAAGKMSRNIVEYGLLPLGAAGLGIATLLLGVLGPGTAGAMILVALIGIAAGFVNVPLNALKQWRSPAERRGAVIAFSNIFIYAGILVGSLAGGALATLGLSTRTILVLTGLAVSVGAVWTVYLLPDSLLRLVLVIATNTLYRLRIVGAENIPARGGAVLVPNHVSFVDGILLLASTDRRIRFVVDLAYYNHPVLRPFMRSLRAIPISAAGGPKSILKALRDAGRALDDGEVVCIFPEGQITRIGMLLPFRRGFERVVKGRDVPIIPVYLDRLWGGVFSRAGRHMFLRAPEGIPHPATVAIGEPLEPGTPIDRIRSRVCELGAEAWMLRKPDTRPLHRSWVRTCRARPWRLAFVDQTRHVSRFKALVGAIALARGLQERWEGQRRVGILLPATVAGALVNLAAALAGKVAVNLNFTAGKVAMASACRQAGLRTVVTAGMFVAKADVQVPDEIETIWLEEIAGSIGTGARLTAMFLALFAPASLLERACGTEEPVTAGDTATIIFSSGSTGDPKGISLTHFNVDTNVRASIQVLSLEPRDRFIGILPLFHSFGYTVTLWLPAILGLPVIYHPSPLDSLSIGELVQKHRGTVLLSTPTFLQLFVRRIAPSDFGSLRLVITGAEKMPRQVADAFRDHFGIDPLEGYGITETTPVISVNVFDFRGPGIYQPGWRRGSVGRAIPGVAVRIADPETEEILGPEAEGMIWIKGPNVMPGYLGRDDLTADVMRDGWYITGDIGRLDADGFLTITDRYSRFSKIGGEMVPHGVIEKALHDVADVEDRVFAVTAVVDERKGERLVVVHTLDEKAIPPILERLPSTGLPNLFTPRKNQFVRVDELPLLGTGKTDLRGVRRIAEDAMSESGS